MRLVFTRSRGVVGRLIRAFEGGVWDHVAIVDGEHVIEATMLHGVRRRTLASLLHDRPEHEVVDVPTASPGHEALAIAWARAQVGRPYDFGGAIGFLFWRGSWADSSRWYCSELAAGYCIRGMRQIAGQHRRIGVRLMHAVASAWAWRAV